MKLSGSFAASALALVLAVGCSSSSKTPTTTPTTPGGSGAAAIGVAACSLATKDQVKGLIGASPTGQESPSGDVSKVCVWSSGGTQMAVGVIRLGGGQMGFSDKLAPLNAVGLQGVGDTATYGSGRSAGGQNEVILVTNKGTISLSIDVRYAGSKTPPASSQAVLTSIARNAFTQLGF